MSNDTWNYRLDCEVCRNEKAIALIIRKGKIIHSLSLDEIPSKIPYYYFKTQFHIGAHCLNELGTKPNHVNHIKEKFESVQT